MRLALLLALIAAPAAAQQVVADPQLAAEIDRRTAAITDKVVAWRHDIHQHPELGYAEKRTAAIVALGDAWKNLGTYESVGYLGNDGNYIEAATGLHNVTRFNSPLDAVMSQAAQAELCAGIAREDLRVLILGEAAPNPSRCQPRWTVKKDRRGVLVAFRQPPEAAASSKVASAP